MPAPTMPRRAREFDRFLIDQLTQCWRKIYELEAELVAVRSLIPFADVVRPAGTLGLKLTASVTTVTVVAAHPGLGLTAATAITLGRDLVPPAAGLGLTEVVGLARVRYMTPPAAGLGHTLATTITRGRNLAPTLPALGLTMAAVLQATKK